jgi:DUF1680 family protein
MKSRGTPDATGLATFWRRYQDLVSATALPYQWKALNDQIPGIEPSHAVRNFRIAAGREQGEFYGFVFQDSDVAKWLETLSYSLMHHRDPELERHADEVIELIEKAQQPDGYLNTYFTIKEPGKRWTNLHEGHELYCAGHFIEAAVAYHRATGKGRLLDVVRRYADLILRTFGPEPQKLRGYCGHPEIELALVKLAETTGERSYVELARFFIDERGREPYYFDLEYERRGRTHILPEFRGFGRAYLQAHLPVRQQATAEGHAVRVTYLFSAVADVARLTGDASLRDACRRVWENVTERRMYVTGGIGSTSFGESFTLDYDLPSDTMYAETCASVGMVFWAHRMLKLDIDGRYSDVMELELYNGALSGISLDGTRYFYVNPIESFPERSAKNHGLRHVKSERQPWYACSCCPSNITRLIASLGQYVYSVQDGQVYAHLYVGGEAVLPVGGTQLRLEQETNYPYEGTVRIMVRDAPAEELAIHLRIPGWCEDYSCEVNGMPWTGAAPRKGYLAISRRWKQGDVVDLSLDMPVRLIRSNPKVRGSWGRVAIGRGPLVYCLEEMDNGPLLHDISLADSPEWNVVREPTLLGGTVVIEGGASRTEERSWDDSALYAGAPARRRPVRIRAVPYALWANRGRGEMTVWIHSGP